MTKAEATHAIVTRTELLGAGMPPGRLERWCRAGHLVPLTPGVYRMAGAPPTFESQVMAAISAFEGETWAAHHTAARLWGIATPSRASLIEVVRPKPLSAGRAGLRVHRSTLLPDHHLTSTGGIPVTTPARTVFDLARTVGPRGLDRVIEQVTQRRLATVAAIYRVLYDLGGRGRPGTRRLRAVLARWDAEEPATESELDIVGRALLASIGGIEWQVPLADEQGHIRTVDGLVRPAKLVIEFDGAAFHDTPAARALDDHHDRRLLRLGYRVRRLGWSDVTRRSDITRAEIAHLATSGAIPIGA